MGAFARKVLGMKTPKKTPLETTTKNRAHDIRNCNDNPYFKTLLVQIEQAGLAPVQVGSEREMIEQIGRGNAHRTLLEVLKKDLQTAERVIAADQERQRGR